MKADLHIHSKYSDGTLNIKQIGEYADSKGIDIIAITDHNNLNSHKDIINNEAKVRMLKGVELSSTNNEESVHVLGYFSDSIKCFDIMNIYFDKRKIETQSRMDDTSNKLKKHFGIEITYKDILFFNYGILDYDAIGIDVEFGIFQILSVLSKKYLITKEEAIEKYIGKGQAAYVEPYFISTEFAVNLLKENNALVSLAHPYVIRKTKIDELIKSCGFDGIEVMHPNNSKNKRKEYYEIAREQNLIITGGSDFHGPGARCDMGDSMLQGDYANKFLNKLERKR